MQYAGQRFLVLRFLIILLLFVLHTALVLLLLGQRFRSFYSTKISNPEYVGTRLRGGPPILKPFELKFKTLTALWDP